MSSHQDHPQDQKLNKQDKNPQKSEETQPQQLLTAQEPNTAPSTAAALPQKPSGEMESRKPSSRRTSADRKDDTDRDAPSLPTLSGSDSPNGSQTAVPPKRARYRQRPSERTLFGVHDPFKDSVNVQPTQRSVVDPIPKTPRGLPRQDVVNVPKSSEAHDASFHDPQVPAAAPATAQDIQDTVSTAMEDLPSRDYDRTKSGGRFRAGSEEVKRPDNLLQSCAVEILPAISIPPIKSLSERMADRPQTPFYFVPGLCPALSMNKATYVLIYDSRNKFDYSNILSVFTAFVQCETDGKSQKRGLLVDLAARNVESNMQFFFVALPISLAHVRKCVVQRGVCHVFGRFNPVDDTSIADALLEIESDREELAQIKLIGS